MLISHKNKFIFVHIYKTAGTSVTSVFLPHSRLIDRLVFEFVPTRKFVSLIIRIMNWYDDGQKQFTGVHKHAKAIDILNYLGEKKFFDYYKFVFVRNPYDLMVSLYFYISQSKNHIDYAKVSDMSFKEFLVWYISKTPPLQLDFIRHPKTKEIIVDYIGKFETLDKDIDCIQRKLELNTVKNLTHLNPSSKRKSKDFRAYYDEETKSMVGSYFKEDLDVLGYDFNGIAV